MIYKVKLPRLGETVDEVLVTELILGLGETVSQGDALMIVETDKVDAEVPCPVSGTLKEWLVAEDDEVATGTVICTIET